MEPQQSQGVPKAATWPPEAGRPSNSKPLLLVDIDGVISLFGFGPGGPPPGQFLLVDGIAHLLSATAGEHLLRLSKRFELVWCSGWEEKANEYLPMALGLAGPLPFLSFERNPGRGHAHWKLAAIEAHAGDRPFAWIDDAFNDACHEWAAQRSSATLLVTTQPASGMTRQHVEQLEAWAR